MNSNETNPFDDETVIFLVLRNGSGQYSLWPAFAAVPRGWTVEAGPDSRPACLQFVEERWGPALRPTLGLGTRCVQGQTL